MKTAAQVGKKVGIKMIRKGAALGICEAKEADLCMHGGNRL